MFLNFSSVYMMNQALKNIFCVPRHFLLDTRIQPYTIATGYSFPNGHIIQGTAVYSSADLWKKRKWFVIIYMFMILLTLFTRSGVSILVTLLVVFCQHHCCFGWKNGQIRMSWFLVSALSGM